MSNNILVHISYVDYRDGITKSARVLVSHADSLSEGVAAVVEQYGTVYPVVTVLQAGYIDDHIDVSK